MEPDDPLEQVHAAKEAVAAKYGYNLRAMVEAFRAMDEAETTRRVLEATPRPPVPREGFTTVQVPNELLPTVRQLINEWQDA